MTNAAYVAIACGIIVDLGTLGASIGIALMGGKFLEGSKRSEDELGFYSNAAVLNHIYRYISL